MRVILALGVILTLVLAAAEESAVASGAPDFWAGLWGEEAAEEETDFWAGLWDADEGEQTPPESPRSTVRPDNGKLHKI